jgi:hypothetical protein
VAGVLAMGVWGCASDKTPPSGVVSAGLVTSTAKVESLDQASRQIALRLSDGSIARFRVGDEVRNLAQVKVGDNVKVAYYESLAWEVKKPGQATPGAAMTDEVGRAKLGEKPAGVAARTLTVTSTIAAIDKSAKTVTLRSATGELTTIKVRDPKNLDRVSVGELVEISYTEGVAVSVETPAK